MKRRPNIFELVGLDEAPWAIRIYILVVFGFLLLLIVASALPVALGFARLGEVASDGLKTALAALLGALSQARATRRRHTETS